MTPDTKIATRLRKVAGQITSIEAMLARGEACDVVIPQLLAARAGLGAVLRVYIEHSLERCDLARDEKEVKKLISALTKHT